MEMVPIAKYKVAWWGKTKTLHSAMFETYEDALAFAKSQRKDGNIVTLMELKHSDKTHGRYDWIVHAFDVGDFLHFFSLLYRHRLWIGLGLGGFYLHRRRKSS